MFEAYFDALDPELLTGKDGALPSDALGRSIQAYTQPGKFPDCEGLRIAIIGVGDTRGSHGTSNDSEGADAIRRMLYQLKLHQNPLAIADFGNLRPGADVEDTYAAIATVVSELLPLKIIPIFLGGSQDLTYGHYAGYKKCEQIINIVSVDARFDLGMPEDPLSEKTFLGKIILEQPNYLFQFSNLGYQTYFVGNESVELMKKLYFDTVRLGQVRADLTEAEPVVRSADVLSVDVSSIRQADAPGNTCPSPNGFYGEEICQIMMYSGLSEKLSGLGIYEYSLAADRNFQTAHLIAQMIWYFVEGVGNRKQDLPLTNPANYMTYRVTVPGLEEEVTFIKSLKSDRWWMKLPLDKARNRYTGHHLIPCSYRDYQQACNSEVPDRWWNALQKMI